MLVNTNKRTKNKKKNKLLKTISLTAMGDFKNPIRKGFLDGKSIVEKCYVQLILSY